MTQIRKMLKSHGIERTHAAFKVMPRSRIYPRGDPLRQMVNLHAHEPSSTASCSAAFSGWSFPADAQPSSERCSPASESSVRFVRFATEHDETPKQDDYPIYRCPTRSDCDHQVTISAVIAEDVVSSAVRAALQDAQGHASMAENATGGH